MSKMAKFGLKTPHDLYEKLKYDAELLLRRTSESAEEQRLEEYEAFNFFVTAWHLYHDWLKKGSSPHKPKHFLEKIDAADSKFKEIKDAIRNIANGSKHFEFNQPTDIVVGDREISCFYSYCFGPQYTIDTRSFHFLMYELIGLIMKYFEWIFDDTAPIEIPLEITKKLGEAQALRTARKNIPGKP